MTTRKLAQFEVSSVGIGCMGFSHGYGALPPEEESIRLMRKAFDMGCTLFDTAEVYGPFVNETLVGKAVKPFRDKIVLTTKFTPCRVGDQDITDSEKLTAKGIRKALEDSLRRAVRKRSRRSWANSSRKGRFAVGDRASPRRNRFGGRMPSRRFRWYRASIR